MAHAALGPTLVCALLLAVRGAGADEPSAADVSAARELGRAGLRLADAGKCEQAVQTLGRAEKLYHAPTILGRLGECEIKLGKLVQGTEDLQRVVHEALPPNPPPQFVKARARAQKVLDDARPKIGRLKIVLVAPPKIEVTIKIDGEAVSSALVGEERPTDPGEHFVEATAPGYLKSSETVMLKEGGSDSVVLSLKVDPEAPPPPTRDTRPPPPPAGATGTGAGSGRGLRVSGVVALGVGAVGLGIGTVAGVVAMGARSDLDRQCPAKTCPPNGLLGSANTMAGVSTFGFVLGAVGVAAGVTFLLWPAPSAPAPNAAWVRPYAVPTELGVAGAF